MVDRLIKITHITIFLLKIVTIKCDLGVADSLVDDKNVVPVVVLYLLKSGFLLVVPR